MIDQQDTEDLVRVQEMDRARICPLQYSKVDCMHGLQTLSQSCLSIKKKLTYMHRTPPRKATTLNHFCWLNSSHVAAHADHQG